MASNQYLVRPCVSQAGPGIRSSPSPQQPRTLPQKTLTSAWPPKSPHSRPPRAPHTPWVQATRNCPLCLSSPHLLKPRRRGLPSPAHQQGHPSCPCYPGVTVIATQGAPKKMRRLPSSLQASLCQRAPEGQPVRGAGGALAAVAPAPAGPQLALHPWPLTRDLQMDVAEMFCSHLKCSSHLGFPVRASA